MNGDRDVGNEKLGGDGGVLKGDGNVQCRGLSKLGQEGEFRVLAASTGALASENVCDASPGIASSIVVLRLYEICVATAASIPFKTSVSPADDEDVRHGRWRIPVVCAADCDVEASRDGALL